MLITNEQLLLINGNGNQGILENELSMKKRLLSAHLDFVMSLLIQCISVCSAHQSVVAMNLLVAGKETERAPRSRISHPCIYFQFMKKQASFQSNLCVFFSTDDRQEIVPLMLRQVLAEHTYGNQVLFTAELQRLVVFLADAHRFRHCLWGLLSEL